MKALIRCKAHQRPMLAVLDRYGIGETDPYGRGRWISEKDLPAIAAKMDEDPKAIRGVYGGEKRVYVQGTCRHNHVCMADFREAVRA